jgi:hypothetical protein
MYHPFYGADSLEDFEARLKTESIILDSEMIERGESPLFMSVYDRLYMKNAKKRQVETKSDADIVDDIFKAKLEKKKPQVEKAKGLAAFQKKVEPKVKCELEISRALEITLDNSDKQFIISLFK